MIQLTIRVKYERLHSPWLRLISEIADSSKLSRRSTNSHQDHEEIMQTRFASADLQDRSQHLATFPESPRRDSSIRARALRAIVSSAIGWKTDSVPAGD